MNRELLSILEILLMLAGAIVVKLIMDFILPGSNMTYDQVLLYYMLTRLAHIAVDTKEIKQIQKDRDE